MEKVDKKNIRDVLALTPIQEGMLFHYLGNPEGNHYFAQLNLKISGKINPEFFEKAWNLVLETNEMLRTVFRWEELESPVQMVLKEHKLQPRYHDLSDLDNHEREKRLQEIHTRERQEKFDLTEVPFRVALCKVSGDKHRMIISHHHILYDGWSNGILLKEFFNAYDALSKGKEWVKPVKTKFKEYLEWVQNQRKDPGKEKKFWRNYLKDFDTLRELPLKTRREEREIADQGHFRICLAGNLQTELERFTKKHKITLAALLYSSWGLLLQKYDNSRDVVFGTTVSGRSAKVRGIEEMVGLFISTLPMRVRANPNEKIRDLLERIKKDLQAREAYEATPLVEIKECSELEHNEALFDTVVVLENYPLDHRFELTRSGFSLAVDSYEVVETTHYDLTLGITVFDGIKFDFTYNNGTFAPGTIEGLGHHLQCIVRMITQNPGNEIGGIEILAEEEKNQVLYEFNRTARDYPQDKTIRRIFAEQVEQTPGAIAVVSAHEYLTYRQLSEKAGRLANYLYYGRGIRPEDRLGLITDRCNDAVIAIIAILMAGGVYVPIDPLWPGERVKAILKDAGISILISQETYLLKNNRLQDDSASPLSFFYITDGEFDEKDEADESEGFKVRCPVKGDNLAYIMYTSGSTGRPKGVMVEHRNVVNLSHWFSSAFHLQPGTHFLQLTDYSFDPSVEDIFAALHSGATLYVGSRELGIDRERFRGFVNKHRIHIIDFIPLAIKELLGDGEKLESLQVVISGGERLDDSLKDLILKKGYRLYNHYGPTEITVDALSSKCSPEPVNLGKPISNTTCYILDKDDKLTAIGAKGELYIAGAGVSRGYLNNPELTAQKFPIPGLPPNKKFLEVQEPFFKKVLGRRRHKLYRTGDLVRWLPGGSIEFLGRIDQQVKIRGFRVEPGEIENRLHRHAKVKEALVTVITDVNNDKQLCVYVVTRGKFDLSRLKQYLAGSLPGYMIPAYFVPVEKIPLNPNGRVDRQALPEPGIIQGEIYAPPGNEPEEKLLEIWSHVLGIEKAAIGIHDNFFDLGGNSLKVIRLNSKIKKLFKKDIPILALFRFTTISAFAQFLRAGKIPGHISNEIGFEAMARGKGNLNRLKAKMREL